jgi:SRR1
LQAAYCNLQIEHWASLQDKDTKTPKFDPPLMSLESTRDFFRKNKMAWEESGMCQQLRDISKSAILPRGIRKIIGLACGSISLCDSLSLSHRSASQHALLLTLLDVLRERDEDMRIACFAQDPVYTSADKAVLIESGIQPLEDAHGILEIDDCSVVFSTAPDIPVKEIVADIARPSLLIWDRVKEVDEKPKVLGVLP